MSPSNTVNKQLHWKWPTERLEGPSTVMSVSGKLVCMCVSVILSICPNWFIPILFINTIRGQIGDINWNDSPSHLLRQLR